MEFKEDRRKVPRAAWRSVVGPTPRLGPDDRFGAGIFLAKIQRALDQGGWKKGERVRLHKMKRVWSDRLDGKDDRFRRYGNRKNQNSLVQVDERVRGQIDESRQDAGARTRERASDRSGQGTGADTDRANAGGIGAEEQPTEKIQGPGPDDQRVRKASQRNWGWGR